MRVTEFSLITTTNDGRHPCHLERPKSDSIGHRNSESGLQKHRTSKNIEDGDRYGSGKDEPEYCISKKPNIAMEPAESDARRIRKTTEPTANCNEDQLKFQAFYAAIKVDKIRTFPQQSRSKVKQDYVAKQPRRYEYAKRTDQKKIEPFEAPNVNTSAHSTQLLNVSRISGMNLACTWDLPFRMRISFLVLRKFQEIY